MIEKKRIKNKRLFEIRTKRHWSGKYCLPLLVWFWVALSNASLSGQVIFSTTRTVTARPTGDAPVTTESGPWNASDAAVWPNSGPASIAASMQSDVGPNKTEFTMSVDATTPVNTGSYARGGSVVIVGYQLSEACIFRLTANLSLGGNNGDGTSIKFCQASTSNCFVDWYLDYYSPTQSLSENEWGMLVPGNYSFISSAFASVSVPPTNEGLLTTFSRASCTFEIEPCLTITHQPPPQVNTCSADLAILSITAKGASLAGPISYQWYWRISSMAGWNQVMVGPNIDSGIGFFSTNPQASWIILNFTDLIGGLPAGAHPEFRCIVANSCTSKTSSTSRVSGCGECPPTLGTHPAKWKKAECVNGVMVLVEPQTNASQLPGYFDCSKPTVPVFHGWLNGPDSDWIPCIACEIAGNQQAFPNGVNVLVADSSEYMKNLSVFPDNVFDVMEYASDVIHDIEQGNRPDLPLPTLGDAAQALLEARGNAPIAARELADDFACHLGNCASHGGIPIVVGDGFGGAMAAKFGSELQYRGFGQLGTLYTFETAWRLGLFAAEGAMASSSFANHVNYFSDRRGSLGLGNELDPSQHPNVRNYQANSTLEDQLHACGIAGPFDYLCLAHLACDFFRSPGGRDMISGTTPAGNYHEGQQPFIPFPGLGADYTLPPEDIWRLSRIQALGCFVLSGNPLPQFDQGINFENAASILRVFAPSNQSSGISYGIFPFPQTAGYFVFEYQIDGNPASQFASLTLGGALKWEVSEPTPSNGWATAIVSAVGYAGTTQPIAYSIRHGMLSTTGAELRVRNIRFVDVAAVTQQEGDMNGDELVDGRDIQIFVKVIIAGSVNNISQCAADMDNDGQIDEMDLEVFLEALLN